MSTNFLHGVELLEVESGTRTIATVRSSVVGIVGTAPDAVADAFPLNKPVLVTTSKDVAKLGATGTLRTALEAIRDQAGAVVVVIRVAKGATDAETRANVIGNSTDRTGVYALLAAESVVQLQPRLLCAPGFTSHRDEDPADPGKYLVNPVVGALETVAKQLRATAFVEGPNTTDTDATAYAAQLGTTGRVYVVDPYVTKYAADGSLVEVPGSAVAIGIQVRIDNEFGFWRSPSNQPVYNIAGLARPIDFVLGSESSRANILNEGNVATFINQNGFRLWGNRVPTQDPRFQFLCVRRTADIINDSILRAHLWAVDRGITKTYLNDVVEGVNAYLRYLRNLGAIIDGRCWADPDLNSPDQIAQGKVYFNFDFTPVYPAERVVFRSILTNDYLEELV